MTKVYFILNSVTDAHSRKRVSDFSKAGAEVKVFGFLRNQKTCKLDGITVLGSFNNTLSYRKRLNIYFLAIKKILNEFTDEDITWYLLGLDVAWVTTTLKRDLRYVYEECDLVHTYIYNKLIRGVFELIDKRIIRKSLFTILTSEGFIDFHYGERHLTPPKNIILAKNKLPEEIKSNSPFERPRPDSRHIRFAFVGMLRYKELLNVADVITKKFPQHSFDFYGFIEPKFTDDALPKRKNIHYHGKYDGAKDLPQIYRHIDVVVATYDTFIMSERYAEPNKLYEAIYFRCPLVVSSGTFIAEEVDKLGIGYNVDAHNDAAIVELVHKIEKDLPQKCQNITNIDQSVAIDNNEYAKRIIKSLANPLL